MKSVALHQLSPGMVIGEDLRHESGAILLAKGSSLSDTTIRTLITSSRFEGGRSNLLVYT
jgi:hypothetical protein